MYKRFDAATSDILMQQYLDDRTFQVLTPALQEVAERHDDLAPVEVWNEALGVISRLAAIKRRRDLAVRQIRQDLLSRYRAFLTVDNKEKVRNYSEAQRTADIVLTTVVVMLSGTNKDSEANPHTKILSALATMLKGSPAMIYIMNKAEAGEAADERYYGEIPEHDYLKEEDELAETRELLRKAGAHAANGKKEVYAQLTEELLGNEQVAKKVAAAESKETCRPAPPGGQVTIVLGDYIEKQIYNRHDG